MMKKLRSFLLLVTLTIGSASALPAQNNHQVSTLAAASAAMLPADVVPDGIY
jgi:hypothetical protein